MNGDGRQQHGQRGQRAAGLHLRQPLDEEHSAHRYLEAIEHTVVGFYWEW